MSHYKFSAVRMVNTTINVQPGHGQQDEMAAPWLCPIARDSEQHHYLTYILKGRCRRLNPAQPFRIRIPVPTLVTERTVHNLHSNISYSPA